MSEQSQQHNTTDSREVWIDVMRATAILMVILVHTLQTTSNESAILLIFSRLGVPLFIMISGAMLLRKQEEFTVFLYRRVLRLLKPWLFWSIVATCVLVIERGIPVNITGWLNEWRGIFVSYAWFMPMLFALYLLTPSLRVLVKYSGDGISGGLLFMWLMGLVILPYYRNTAAFPLHTDNGIVRQVCMYGGYYLAGFWLLNKRSHWWLITVAIGYFLILFEKRAWPEMIAYTSPTIVLSSIGIFGWVSSQRNRLENMIAMKYRPIFAEIGKSSLGIYFAHQLSLSYLNVSGIWGAVLLFTASLITVLALTRIGLLKSWVR